MREYHKIHSVFKRDEKGLFLEGEYTCPEFKYLANCLWRWTEKIDGTNIRVRLSPHSPPQFGGRTDNAQLPITLYKRLNEIFPPDLRTPDHELTLYGEGYGAKIQKGGGNYIPDGCDFILFDVRVEDWWLQTDDVYGVADHYGLRVVPSFGYFTLEEAIEGVRDGKFTSSWPNVQIEGVVGTPLVPLYSRGAHRIITKIKGKDLRVG